MTIARKLRHSVTLALAGSAAVLAFTGVGAGIASADSSDHYWVQFEPGTSGSGLGGEVYYASPDVFSLEASAGQAMQVTSYSEDGVAFTIISPSGEVIGGAWDETTVILPESGVYKIRFYTDNDYGVYQAYVHIV